MNREMQKALEADGEKLRQLTGEDHGPVFMGGRCPTCHSPDPARHPAMQHEGEVQLCPDPWHDPIADLWIDFNRER